MKKYNGIQPEGNYYDKYNSKNIIVQWMMRKYFKDLDSLLPKAKDEIRILEAGCGEGEVAVHIAKHYQERCKIDAFDISEQVITYAQNKFPDIRFTQGNIYDIADSVDCSGEGYGLVLCCEVLEHLEYPEKALEQLTYVSDEYMIVSVPSEPIWRLLNIIRGKYLKDFGNTPGHIQHWSCRKFVDFLRKSGMKVEKIKKPLPWTMVLLKKDTY